MTHRCKPSSCVGCALHDHGNDFSAVEGTCANGTMLVAEASGEHEQRDQLPLRPYAPSGAVLERCLRRMGLDRKQFAITNCARCRPRNNWLEGSPYEYAALRHCRPNLDQAIADYRPRCIVSLGGVALRELTGEAGEARGVTHLAGYCLPLQRNSYSALLHSEESMSEAKAAGVGDISVLINFHPSYLRRGKASHQGVFSRIIQRGLAIASGRDRAYMWGVDPDDPTTWQQPSGERLQYWTKPSLDQCRSVLYYLQANPNIWIAKDIETSESSSLDEDAREGFSDTEVRLFQLSYQPGTGIAIPYTGEFKAIVREMLHLPNPFYGHNWDNFDHKVLRAAALREGWTYAPNTKSFDTLDMFHHWQPDLPANLQFASSFINFPFPWKHLAGTDIEFYGICDVDADLRLGKFLEATLKKDNLFGEGEAYSLTLGYTGQEREVRPVLAAMEDRGVPIDDAARLRLGAEFEAAQRELGKELAERAPVECQRVHPKEGYAGMPPQVKQWFIDHGTEPKHWVEHPIDELKELHEARFQDKPTTAKDGTIEEGEWYSYQRRKFPVAGLGEIGEPEVHQLERWCRVYDFNPNSAPQLIAYMKAKGHRVPKSKIEDDEGKQKDTTAKKELTRLAHKTGDSFYLKVIEFRELTKAKGTYIDGFKPASDGCVHTTYTFSTGTGQLSSRNPNVQNFYAHGKLAEAMGRMIAAPPGYIITKWDYRAFHVLTTGFESECTEWMRLARLDMHSFVAGEFLKVWDATKILSETDEELLERFAWFKSDPKRKYVRDKQAKAADLGIGFGEGPRRVFQENMEHFKNEKQAKDFHDILKHLFKPVFDWQERIQMKAHQDQKLTSKFGHIRRFYEVMRWDGKKGAWGHGDQAEEAVAFLPANHAHSHMREMKKEVARRGLDVKYGLMNEVHDAFWYCYPAQLREEHLAEMAPLLRSPSPVLRHDVLAPVGLWCDVEAGSGPNITDIQKDKLPNAGTGAIPLGLTLPSTLTPLTTITAGTHNDALPA